MSATDPDSCADVVSVLISIAEHLDLHGLPVGFGVQARTFNERVLVQLANQTVRGLAAEVIAWADTLTAITAQAWRTLDGQRVLLAVIGRLPGGESVRADGTTSYAEFTRAFGVEIDPARRTPIELGALRDIAETGEGQA